MTGTASSHFSAGAGNPFFLRRPGTTTLARQALLYAISALILCAPAFYNGYPIIFPDLLDYGVDGMRILRFQWPSGNHPPLYGVAIEFLHLERTLWPVVFVQGFIVSHLIAVVLRSLGVRLSAMAFLALIAGLAALTSLPWYVAVVMPDLFGGILVLCLFLLISRPRQLSVTEKVYFAGLAIASLLFHVSFIPVAIGIIAIAAVFAFLRRREPSRPHLGVSLLVLVSALAISGLISFRFWGNTNGPPYAPPYLLAHVLVDGPGKQFLARECGVQHFVLCDYQNSIPDDVEDFMFRSYSPFFSSWATRQVRAESSAIVVGTFKMFPLQTIQAALRDALTQVVTFYTEVSQLEDLPNDRGGSYGTEFAIRLPFVARGYVGSAQEQGLLSAEHLRWMNALDAAVVALATLVILRQLLASTRRREWPVVELLVMLLVSVAINGLVAGAAVGVFGRFGARVIWLLPFAAIASTLAMTRRRELYGPKPATVRRRSDVASDRAHTVVLPERAGFQSGAHP